MIDSDNIEEKYKIKKTFHLLKYKQLVYLSITNLLISKLAVPMMILDDVTLLGLVFIFIPSVICYLWLIIPTMIK